jgi:hypothetical protein
VMERPRSSPEGHSPTRAKRSGSPNFFILNKICILR